MVEQRTENPCVPGSIPGGTTKQKCFFLKSPEIQQFQGIFLFPKNVKTCRFRNLKISHSVVFQNPSKKTTICLILHLFSIICRFIFQVQKTTFAYLLECRRKEKNGKDNRIRGIARYSVEDTFRPFQKSGVFFRIFGVFSD